MTTLEHLPFSPDLPQVNVYLFFTMKWALKRRRFCDAADIIKNATKKLKGLSQNGL